MISSPFASPLVEVQSMGDRPQRPCKDAGMASTDCVPVAGALRSGGAPVASGAGVASAPGTTVVLPALLSTGSRPLQATIVARVPQSSTGAMARSMAG